MLFVFRCSGTLTYDVIIENGILVDGTGGARYKSDVGVRGGKIAKIGDLSKAQSPKRIDATDLIVAPGFIDAHSHADRALGNQETAGNEIFVTQGVTTSIFGIDGRSLPEQIKSQIEKFTRQGVGTNYAYFVGHNSIRSAVIGRENRPPTDEEMERMKAMVKEGMELGALGLSTGLMYLPGRFATTEEVIELAKVVAPYDGVYDSHVRDPARNLVSSVKECLDIGVESGSRPHPGHHKAPGKDNWGKAKEIQDMIKELIDRGIDVTVDQYPYDGAATSRLINVLIKPRGMENENILTALKNPRKREQIKEVTENPGPDEYSWVTTVGYNSFRIVVSKEFPEYVGKIISDIAEEEGRDPFSVIVDIVLKEGDKTKITLGACSEDDVRYILTRPWTMISSDGGLGSGHPRSCGSFTRVLGRYVREWNVLSLEEAVYKMTGLPAKYYKFAETGTLKEGNHADITVFNPETVIERADWENPSELSEGIIHVLVGGAFIFEDGKMTENMNGRFIPFDGGRFIKQ